MYITSPEVKTTREDQEVVVDKRKVVTRKSDSFKLPPLKYMVSSQVQKKNHCSSAWKEYYLIKAHNYSDSFCLILQMGRTRHKVAK